MSEPWMVTTLRRSARLLGRTGPESSDAALLDRLAREGDGEAFGELLTRHGPAAWALCRRLVRSEQDAEDVFQATFLVLARDADRVRKAASVRSWLYGVAARIGRRVRARGDRVPDPARLRPPAAPADPAADLRWIEVRSALDEELARLPDALRAPVLLCYFDGLTQDEAAAELGWTARAVKHRIARARGLLRARLGRRGIDLSAALAVPLLSAGGISAVSPVLLHNLTTAAGDLARGRPPGLSPAVAALTRSEAPVASSLRLAVLLASGAGLLAVGSLIGRPAGPDAAPPPAVVAAPPAPAAEPDPTLPPGEVRIGTTQFRHVGWHSRVFFTDGGKTLLLAGEGTVVRFWDVASGKTLHEIALKGSYEDAAFAHTANLLAVVGWHFPSGEGAPSEDVLWLIDTVARKHVRTVRLPARIGGNSRQVRVSADGKRVVVEYEGDVQVIDARTGDELFRHKGRINAGTLALSPDGKTIAFGRYDVYVWAWDSGGEPRKLAAIGGSGTELVTFTPDGQSLHVAGNGSRVMTFDVATGRQTGTFDVGASPWKWSYSPDGKTLAVVYHRSSRADGFDQAVVLWDPMTGKETGRFPVGRTTASHVSWSPDGVRLAAATDYRAWVWDVKTGRPLGPSDPGHEGSITAFAFAPDGRLFTASDDHTVRSWDPATGKPGLELVHDGWVRDVAVSPDGALVAGSALRNDLRIWDAKTGAERFRLLGNGPMGGRRTVRFTPDSRRLVAWGDDLYLRVWDVRNGKLLAEHRTLPEGITEEQLADERTARIELMGFAPADVSGDGSTFAFCRYKVVQVFDVETGKERMKFEANSNGVERLALSPDGRRLAITGRGKQVTTRLPDGGTRYSLEPAHAVAVWDLAAKKAVWEAAVPGSGSRAIAFSPDGTRLAELASGEDRTSAVRVRDAGTGKDLGRIDLPRSGGHLAFDRTGRRLAVAHWDTTATVYDLDAALKPTAPK
jgi:RNA polymerase sigma factor (sigma-70 family)